MLLYVLLCNVRFVILGFTRASTTIAPEFPPPPLSPLYLTTQLFITDCGVVAVFVKYILPQLRAVGNGPDPPPSLSIFPLESSLNDVKVMRLSGFPSAANPPLIVNPVLVENFKITPGLIV